MNNIIINGVSEVFPLSTTAWKEFSVMEDLTIPIQKPDIKKIISLNIESKITDFEVVKTPVTNKNFEGIISTGYKLIIKGKLIQYIEYIADKCEQTSHSAHFEVPFCTYAVLPDYYVPGNSVNVSSIVEDVFVKQTSPRSFFKNVTMFVYADICCGIAESNAEIPRVLAFDSSVIVDDSGINVFNVEVCNNDLPQIINILSTPLAPIELTTTLPIGYTFNSGILTIPKGAEGATIGFDIVSVPCNVSFTVNVIVNSPPSIEMLSQTPSNLEVKKVSDEVFAAVFNPNSKNVGIATFVSTPYAVLTLNGSLPIGYGYANNILTIQNNAQDAVLNFIAKIDNCERYITLKVSVKEIIKEEIEEVKEESVSK